MKKKRLWGLLTLLFCLTLYSSVGAIPLTIEFLSTNGGPVTPGIVILDFIDGDGFLGSTATIRNLSVSPFMLEGSVSQTVSGEYLFTDTDLLSSLYFNLSDVYSGFSFNVDANFADPGIFGFPDSLVLSLTNSNFMPLFFTSDPRGSNALFVQSYQGREVYEPSGFSISVTDGASPVPEPSTIILFATGFSTFLVGRKKYLRWGICSLLLLVCAPAQAALLNATNQVVINRAPLVYNRATLTFDGLVSIRNIGSSNLGSPMFLVVSGLPESVSVYNATSLSSDGHPMLNLQLNSGGLAPGQSITNFSVKFHNPNKLKFTAVFSVMTNNGTLPPDPGNSGKETLVGVDSNINGIRDDIEIYIDVNFGNSQKNKEGLNQFAQSLQQGIVATTEQESMLAANSFSRALECLQYINQESQAWKSVQSQSVNTPGRFNAWIAHETRLSGKIFPVRPMSEWKTSCTFDPDALSN